jgi:hypothetical protein
LSSDITLPTAIQEAGSKAIFMLWIKKFEKIWEKQKCDFSGTGFARITRVHIHLLGPANEGSSIARPDIELA